MNPYRKAAGFSEHSSDNWDLAFVVTLLFVASLVRVVGAVVLGETFGAEATLALFFTVGCVAHVVRRIAQKLRR
jgi:hypothetical protein